MTIKIESKLALFQDEILEVVEGGNIVMTEDLLILSDLTRRDSGGYSCLATNQLIQHTYHLT